MKKKRFAFFILLAGLLLLAVSCGKSDKVNEGSALTGEGGSSAQVVLPEEDKSAYAPAWSVSHTALEGAYELATVKDNRVYGCYYTGEGLMVLVQEPGTDGSARTVASYQIPGVTEIRNITVDSGNRICLFGAAETGNTLWQINQDGEVSTIEDIEVEGMEDVVSSKAFFADSNGYYYLWYELMVPCTEVYEDGEEGVYTALDRIYVMDADMNTVCFEQVPDSQGNRAISLLFDGDGVPMLFAKDQEGYYTRRVRTEKREEYEKNRLDQADEAAMYELERGGNIALAQEGLLYTQNGALHLYHTGEGRDEKLLELASGGILEEDIIYLGMCGETIEIIDNYQGSEVSEYTRFETGRSEQITLSMGVMSLDAGMGEVLTDFNRQQDKVRIDPVVYVEDYDYEAGYEKLKLDVIQGKAPDLICTEGIEFEILANAGAFMDLYEFMADDPECGREMFLPSVLQAYEMGGHLYTAAPAFSLHTLWGGGSLVQGRCGVGMEELIQLLENSGGDINSIYGFAADEGVLRNLCSLAMGGLVDWEKGTCDFTGEEFGAILKFAKEYKGPQFESLYGAIQDKKILLTLGFITSVEDYQMESELYGEKIEFIGCPTAEGSGSVVLFLGDALAVNAKTSHPAEAWEFMKHYLLHGGTGAGFPVTKEGFEKVLAESMEEEMTEEDGKSVRVPKRYYSEANSDISLLVYKAEQADVDAVRKLVEGAAGKYEYYNTIQNIIDEEAESYFRDQKTLEEVVKIIQNRVQLYLNER